MGGAEVHTRAVWQGRGDGDGLGAGRVDVRLLGRDQSRSAREGQGPARCAGLGREGRKGTQKQGQLPPHARRKYDQGVRMQVSKGWEAHLKMR